MKKFFYNIGYFFKEAKIIFKVDFLSNLFSIFSIGLIFFILSMIFSGWRISTEVVEVLKKEAEINVYYSEELEDIEINDLIKNIGDVSGVREVNLVDQEESYKRMVDILGKEASILELFSHNPFTSFIEVKIHMEDVEDIVQEIEKIDNIEYIRDNKEVINSLQRMITILTILGVLVITAVGISTLVVVSHIIRQGIYNNREQINTLKLLGAPDSFIGFPFMLEGLGLTIGGGILSSILVALTIFYGYQKIGGSLFFIPLPSREVIISSMAILNITLSIILGIIGSLFGLSSAKTTG